MNCVLLAQNFPRDTSYTIHSAYDKYHQKYPQIQVAKTAIDDHLDVQRNLIYRRVGNRELHLDVFRNQTEPLDKRPLVVLIHGGGWISGDRSLLESMAIRIANDSFVTATVEYRLSPEAPYPAAVQDIKFAIRWLKTHADSWGIDSTRVAILGTSAGGQLATLVGYSDGFGKYEIEDTNLLAGSKVQGVIDIDGVLAFHHPQSEEGHVAGLWIGGSYEQVPELWEEASALTHAGVGDPSTLFVNSSFSRFHAGQDDVIQILSQYDINTEVFMIPNTPHSFWLFDPWFEETMSYVLNFLHQVFPPEVSIDDSRK